MSLHISSSLSQSASFKSCSSILNPLGDCAVCSRFLIKIKQKMLGLIFPEKLEFVEGEYRTKEANEILMLLCSSGKGFSGWEKEKASVNGSQSCMVVPTPIESGYQNFRKLLFYPPDSYRENYGTKRTLLLLPGCSICANKLIWLK